MMAAFGTGEGEGMSGSARITINGHTFISWRNTYDKWYFRNDDEKINVFKTGLGIKDEILFGYRTSVNTIKRRLQLAGYDLKSAEKDFNDTKAAWIKEIYDTLELHKNEVKLRGHFLLPDDLYHITEDLRVLKNTDFKSWLRKLPEALKIIESPEGYKLSDRKKWDPLLYFMVSFPIAIDVNNLGFVGSIFPCMQKESYAVVLLSLSDNDDECILDASELLSGGWTEFLDEQGQSQSSETKYYNDFLSSLDELSELNKEKESPLLQRMIYSSVITSMEAYLSDTMKRHVLNRHAIKRRFVEYFSFFDKNIKESKVFEFMDTLDGEINKQIDKISFHNKDVVVGLYKHVLLCDFPEENISELTACIVVRHDIVHRNGKSTDGLMITVTQDDVEKLIRLIHRIVEHIDKQIITGLPDDKMNIVN